MSSVDTSNDTKNGNAANFTAESKSPALPQSIAHRIPEIYKQDGNHAYCQFNFEKAEEFYTQGLAFCPNRNATERRLRSVLYSNRANARFEQGNYEGAIQDSLDSLQFLFDATPQSSSVTECKDRKKAISKNRWRLARALFYGNIGLDGRRDSSLKDLKDLAQECTEDPKLYHKIQTLSRAKESATAFQPWRNMDDKTTRSESFSPQLIRSTFMSPYTELFSFGHDHASTALCIDWDEVCEEKKKINNDIIFSKDVLFGGVGDARHVMATIIHANGCKHTPKLRITMNDVNSCMLLKDVLVLVLSYQIGQMASSARLAMEEKDPILLIAVIYYVSLGYAMPEVVHEKFQSLVRSIFLEKSRENFVSDYPWLAICENDWKPLTKTAMFWVDTSLYESPLPSVSGALNILRSHCADVGMSSLPGNGVFEAKCREQEEKKAEQIRQEREKYSNIENFSSEEIAGLRQASEKEHLSNEEIIEMMMEIIDYKEKHEHHGYDPKHERALLWDKHYCRMTGGAMMPPVIRGQSVEDSLDPEAFLFPHADDVSTYLHPEGPLYRSFQDDDMDASISRVRSHIRKNWKVNPVKFDPHWQKLDDHTDYVVAWVQYYYKQFVAESFHDKLTAENAVWLLFEGTLFEHFGLFFWNLGKAIEGLASLNKLLVEVNHGCILKFCSKVVAGADGREKAGLPTKYSSVLMSNVGDYTGILSNFLQLHPLLTSEGKIYNNVLKNTGLFKNCDEYALGTIALTVYDMGKMLGIDAPDDKPDVWNFFNCWCFVSRKMGSIGPDEVKTWLHRLYLTTAYPPYRDSSARVKEERPNTIDLFLQTCAFCIDTLRYPEHWIMSAIDDLLGAELKSKATILNGSPSEVTEEKSMNRYNISSSQMELQDRLSHWIINGMLPHSLVKNHLLPNGKAVNFQLKLTSYTSDMNGGDSAVLGLLLEKRFDPQFDRNDLFRDFGNIFSMMPHNLFSSMAPNDSKLRNALLKGDDAGHMHILSCIQFDRRDGTVSFFMSEDTFEKYSSYHVSVIRTDGWFRLPWSMHVLSECNRI